MKHSEEHKYFTDKPHSSREGQTLIDVVKLEQFTADVHHYQWSNAGMAGCNAKDCYNQITPELLALLYAKAGCPKQ
eukprot:5801398-Ditylum_brightwellii.AAC.1